MDLPQQQQPGGVMDVLVGYTQTGKARSFDPKSVCNRNLKQITESHDMWFYCVLGQNWFSVVLEKTSGNVTLWCTSNLSATRPGQENKNCQIMTSGQQKIFWEY
ncbi:hypothetical protein XENORESO_000515 [Xenotaenia resolanae]|uniref:Uncharacterized protein n=1 Tax=Xenotaenia resolanae TaxID=208358 RepID=A0ABV0VUR8_9TELE